MFAGWLRDHLTAAGAHDLSGEDIVRQLGPDGVEAMLAIYEQELWEQRFRKFENLFPDRYRKVGDGEWSEYHARSGYPRHMEFFRAGALFDERCFMAGNRCNGPWSFMEMEGATVPNLEAVLAKDARVRSWDGVSERGGRFVGAFLKGIERAYRLVTEDGAFFDCTRDHRFLTRDGWCTLDRFVSLSGGLRLWHTVEDYQANCVEDGYLGDGQPPYWSNSDQGQLPSPTCARKQDLVWTLEDAKARTPEGSYRRLHAGLQSTPGGLQLLSDLCAQFAGPASSQPFLLPTPSNQEWSRLARELVCDARLGGEDGRDQYECRVPVFLPMRSLGVPCMLPKGFEILRSHRQSVFVQPLGQSVEELVHGAERMAIFYPSFHPDLIGGARIVAIAPLGYQPIFDAHVPVWENYRAAGFYHHNTGKTVVGAYETTAHLTGQYPEWWEGRRFDHPIRAVAAGDTNETTRDIIQNILLGDVEHRGAKKSLDGTGMIPTELIGRGPGQLTWKQGAQDLIDHIKVKHVSGGWSTLNLKSYMQGRKVFQGTAKHLIWVDEEPPQDVYDEARIRTMTTKGITLLTYTPLEGLTETVLSFLPAEMRPAENETLETGDWGNWSAFGREQLEDADED